MLIQDLKEKWLMYADEQTAQIFVYQEEAIYFATAQEGLWTVQCIRPYGRYYWKALKIKSKYEQIILQESKSSRDHKKNEQFIHSIDSSPKLAQKAEHAEIDESTYEETNNAVICQLYKNSLLSPDDLVVQNGIKLNQNGKERGSTVGQEENKLDSEENNPLTELKNENDSPGSAQEKIVANTKVKMSSTLQLYKNKLLNPNDLN